MSTYTQYGSWAPNSSTNRRMRLRFDWSVTVTGASARVVLDIYVEARYGFYDNGNSFTVSGQLGSRSGTVDVNVSTNGSQRLWSGSTTVSLTSSPQTVSASASLSGIDYLGAGTSASLSGSVQVPAAASSSAPATPAWLVATPLDRPNVQLKWAAVSGAASYTIHRWDAAGGAWVLRARGVTGDTWVDGTATDNNRYLWRVAADNHAGSSGWRQSQEVYSRPAAPTVLVARQGEQIVITCGPGQSRSTQYYHVEYRPAGGAWTRIATRLSATTGTWTHTPTGTATAQYRVAAVSATPTSAEFQSVWLESPVIGALQPPAAPTLVAPAGHTPAGQAVTLTWGHSPVDATSQTAAEVRWRQSGAQTWSTATITGTTQSRSIGVLSPGGWEWQARTRGSHPDWGAWSGVSAWQVTHPPTVSVTSPTSGATLQSSRVTARVQAADPAGSIQSWRVDLIDSSGTVVEARTGSGAPGVVAMHTVLPDRSSWRLRAAVTSSTGLTTTSSTTTFSVRYAPPATPTLSAEWVEDRGVVTVQADGRGTGPAAMQIRVEASHDGGQTWRGIGTIPGNHGSIEDPLPPLGAEVTYRATSVSQLPSEAVSTPVRIGTDTCRIWITAADGSATAWCDSDPVITADHAAPDTALEYYEGHRLPVAHYGAAASSVVSVEATIDDQSGSPITEWRRLLSGPVWLRSPRGHHLHGAVTGSIRSRDDAARMPITELSLTVTETEQDRG